MSKYIDAFIFPILTEHLQEYKQVAEAVADIWKEYGALAYYEYKGDDLRLEGTRSFVDTLNTNENETIIFGWVVFESLESRDMANKKVSEDPRMKNLVEPLMEPSRMIFDPSKMVYGGYKSFIKSD